ncbi:MAG: endonuclease V [Lachnospiraceae bacterium]|nr:endonuclease V [Lachnospiraceae bacterium]
MNHPIEKQFIAEQEKLLAQIQLKNHIDIDKLRYVAGVDLAYWKENDTEYAVCCIVVIDFQTKEILEKKCSRGIITVPYIPGCLAFREVGLVLETVKLLEHDVELYIFDGNGYLHPRHMGLATHAGILLDKPTIGVAKSYFKVENVDYTEPAQEAFAYEDIVINEEVYGRVVRTHVNVRPIFLSTGHKVDLDTAMEVVKVFVTKDSHIPMPTRCADLMTHEKRKEYQNGSKSTD